MLTVPVAIVDHPPRAGELERRGATRSVQVAQELGLPARSVRDRGGPGRGPSRRRGGSARAAPLPALGPALDGGGVGAYVLYIAIVAYVALFGEPQQEDLGEKLGPVAVQILLIVDRVPICEEVCFRGMLFGGLRERMPRLRRRARQRPRLRCACTPAPASSAVPPLMAFGVILALLYERTGSIVPGILLHMLNNSVALLGQ